MPTTYTAFQCATCVHLTTISTTTGFAFCRAFGDRPIPVDILMNDFPHDQPWPSEEDPQDNGIMYEEIPDFDSLLDD